MKHAATLLLCIISAVLLSACESLPWAEKSNPVSIQQVATYQRVEPFNAIVVDGTMDVDLVNQPPSKRTHELAFAGSQDAVAGMAAFVRSGTLYLRNMEKVYVKGTPHPRVVVPVGELKSITWNGQGTLSGHHIHGKKLTTVRVQGGLISLSGSEIGLRSIVATSGGKANISNINNPQTLTIRGKDNTRLNLSGRARAIEVELSFNSILDARALRAENGFVNVADVAQAHVNVRHSLNAFATGNSSIYYHQQQPELLNKYLRTASSVLFFKES